MSASSLFQGGKPFFIRASFLLTHAKYEAFFLSRPLQQRGWEGRSIYWSIIREVAAGISRGKSSKAASASSVCCSHYSSVPHRVKSPLKYYILSFFAFPLPSYSKFDILGLQPLGFLLFNPQEDAFANIGKSLRKHNPSTVFTEQPRLVCKPPLALATAINREAFFSRKRGRYFKHDRA